MAYPMTSASTKSGSKFIADVFIFSYFSNCSGEISLTAVISYNPFCFNILFNLKLPFLMSLGSISSPKSISSFMFKSFCFSKSFSSCLFNFLCFNLSNNEPGSSCISSIFVSLITVSSTSPTPVSSGFSISMSV